MSYKRSLEKGMDNNFLKKLNEEVNPPEISDKYKEAILKGFQEIENGDFVTVNPDDIFDRKKKVEHA